MKVIQKSTVHGALEYLEEERTMLLRPHNDLLRIMTHVSDGLFLDAVRYLLIYSNSSIFKTLLPLMRASSVSYLEPVLISFL